MSWLSRSIANSLLIDDDEDDCPTVANDDNNHHPQSVTEQEFNTNQDGSDPQTLTVGVKEDLSEFTESLARQLWGVASFLAPPPPPPPPSLPLHPSSRTAQPDTSVSSRKGSPVSGDKDADDISNSNCEDLRCGGETGVSSLCTFPSDNLKENDKDFVGVTDEVLSFAMNIAHHPETWLDFPLSEEEEHDDFDMSDTQWNHASLVEHLVPRLAALRMELCPTHMSESYYWKVYFVLLHSRLTKHDAHLLSTPQIVAARNMWVKELQIQMKSLEGNTNTDYHQDYSEATSSHYYTREPSVLETKGESFDGEDDWIHENNSELDGYNGVDVSHEDISFSDLEDDDCTMPIRSNSQNPF
ncbi:hypothetical protein LXL04_039160 [Taraxacum kok-saghyz]